MLRRIKIQKKLKPGTRQLGRICAPGISLAQQFAAPPPTEGETEEPAAAEVPAEKWIQVATEGDFEGHVDGAFTLDRTVFNSFVQNFRSDPRYHAGADGKGDTPVIPFDFEHASELNPTSGTIPISGAPAPAWALEFEVRDAADGSAELWALAKLGETIRGYIRDNAYRFVSIAFSLDASDPESDAPIGPRISSIAFTNHPFLRDLAPLAASELSGTIERRLGWYDSAGSAEQGLEYTRQCLGLGATATADEVKGEIGKLAAFAAAPDSTPPGVDIDDIFQSLRKIWSLPVTAGVPEVVAELDKATAQMAAPAVTPPVTTPPAPAVPTVATEATPNDPPVPLDIEGNINMALNEFGKKLVKILTKTQSQILLQDEATIELAVSEAVQSTVDLNTILKGMGYTTAADAIAALPEIVNARATLQSALQQIDSLMAMQVQGEKDMAQADVESAASAKGLDAKATEAALQAHRDSLIATEIGKLDDKDRKNPVKLTEAYKAGRKAFLSHYGVANAGLDRLLKNIVAGPNGQQLRVPTEQPKQEDRQLQLSEHGKRQIDLRGLPGRNLTERLESYVLSNGGDKLDREARFDRVLSFKQQAAKGEIEILDDRAA